MQYEHTVDFLLYSPPTVSSMATTEALPDNSTSHLKLLVDIDNPFHFNPQPPPPPLLLNIHSLTMKEAFVQGNQDLLCLPKCGNTPTLLHPLMKQYHLAFPAHHWAGSLSVAFQQLLQGFACLCFICSSFEYTTALLNLLLYYSPI